MIRRFRKRPPAYFKPANDLLKMYRRGSWVRRFVRTRPKRI